MPDIKPCTKFTNCSLEDQFRSMDSELDEVATALVVYLEAKSTRNVNHLAEEIVDLQTACETMLAIINVDVDQVRQRVIDKNAVRGYYKEATGNA
ncbi:MAG: hypothetical protein H6Q72_4708 [Firmicutes bacterium]|nr:hypothetical protein [Bacillota bacterium]